MSKKSYIVTCQVNMCADKEVKVVVKTTKPHLARQLAEKECYQHGYFFAKAVSCKEMN